jgi:hypothetical protein
VRGILTSRSLALRLGKDPDDGDGNRQRNISIDPGLLDAFQPDRMAAGEVDRGYCLSVLLSACQHAKAAFQLQTCIYLGLTVDL